MGYENSNHDKQSKLYQFVPEFTGYRKSDDSGGEFGNIDDNLYQSYRNGKIYFKSKRVYCNNCEGHSVRLNATTQRKLIFLNIGLQECLIQQFQCRKCNTNISTDLSSIVRPNSNITHPVIDHIIHLYSLFSGSLHKIQKSLQTEHNINISHQTIENIILFFDYGFNIEKDFLSGYYIFDSLWVKRNGIWKYMICLFDIELNTIVARRLVESETVENVKEFLNEVLSNQKVFCITTDLKAEYRIALDEAGINQQFCIFHTKQKINRDIKNYIEMNNPDYEEILLIKSYKDMIFDLLDADNINKAKTIKDKLKNDDNLPEIIFKIVWELIDPYFFKLTQHHFDDKIEPTGNRLENCFLKNFNKSIKKLYKTEKGILKRFDLKLKQWNEDNANF